MTVDLTKSWDFLPLEMVWEPESLPKKKKLAKDLVLQRLLTNKRPGAHTVTNQEKNPTEANREISLRLLVSPMRETQMLTLISSVISLLVLQKAMVWKR